MANALQTTKGRAPIFGALSFALSFGGAILVFSAFVWIWGASSIPPLLELNDPIAYLCTVFGIVFAIVGLARREKYWGMSAAGFIIGSLMSLLVQLFVPLGGAF